MPKHDTICLVLKALCYVFIGFTAPLSTALAQWANEGLWPPTINLVVIGGTCIGSAAASLLAFLSGTYSEYLSARKPHLPERDFTFEETPPKNLARPPQP